MSYDYESQVTKWLKANTDLSWTRTGNDTPAVEVDRIYTSRSEGYEVRDVILHFYKECNLRHNEKKLCHYAKKNNELQEGRESQDRRAYRTSQSWVAIANSKAKEETYSSLASFRILE